MFRSLGWVPLSTSDTLLRLKLVCNSVNLNNWTSTKSGSTPFLR